ncbi:MAG: HlyD family efflux transporter periplasmic adaptor subunit [Gammaproteobacteria bacterium]|nr:HlyD family efflux transporter periplasmic adaptor subunit [Gammaproteobacteria bacterium]
MASTRDSISAIGFVEPLDGIINIGGFTSSTGAIVSEVHIGEGDVVKTGQILAILDTHEILQATVDLAEADVGIRRASLEQVKAGTSRGTINAQKAQIKRLKVEIETAGVKCKRADSLHNRAIISDAALEDACLRKKVLEAQLRAASATLASLMEVREVDVAVARARLGMAEAAVVKAKAELERAVFRAPMDGRVLKLHVRPGQLIGPNGILELGRTESMWVRAEIYETDIRRVRVGQQVTVTSEVFPQKLRGSVEKIGLMIGKNRLFAVKASANVDSRVVEIEIKLAEPDSPVVAQLTNLQVTVVIHTAGD